MSNKNQSISLEAKDLSFGYSNKKENLIIGSNVNFQLQKGSFVALLGKNGIGKSTLLRTLSGILGELEGSIYINQKDKKTISNIELAQQISMVLTERLPESQLTVYELVALGRQPYTNWIDTLTKDDVLKINWALELTDTESLKQKHFYQLSDGQLQRVLIARALAQDTEIILLDEPTAHLDIHHTIKIFTLLKKLVKKTNKTVLISSHEVNLSIKLADYLLLMTDKGLESGTSEELINSNTFDSLFSKEVINFNRDLKQFIFQEKN